MPDATPLRQWPYPLETEKIAAGAWNIEELSEALEGSFAIAGNKFSNSTPPSSYPLGMSIMGVNDGAGALGWPYLYGSVVTFKHGDTYAWQWFYQYSGARVFVRQGITANSPAWKDWMGVANQNSPQQFATGAVTVPGKTSDFASVTVTFPSGHFSNTPAVVTTIRGSTPNIGICVANVTSTKFDILVDRPSGASTYVYWIAASNYSSIG